MWSRDIKTFRQKAHNSSVLAFRDADYACAVERPSSWLRRIESAFGFSVICCLGLLIGYAIAWMI